MTAHALFSTYMQSGLLFGTSVVTVKVFFCDLAELVRAFQFSLWMVVDSSIHVLLLFTLLLDTEYTGIEFFG